MATPTMEPFPMNTEHEKTIVHFSYYQDPSATFWLNPLVDWIIYKSEKNVHSWNQLLVDFTDFCVNDKIFFTHHNNSIIEINDNTFFASLYDFKYFHLSQIETMLKQITFVEKKTKRLQFDYDAINVRLQITTTVLNVASLFLALGYLVISN